MGSGFENMNDAIMPYIGITKEDGDSQESSAKTSPMLKNGDSVNLFVDGFGEEGVGSIVEARPQLVYPSRLSPGCLFYCPCFPSFQK